ncbi:MAG: SMC family ATPase [Candidatus Obscuribacterales bacterium]|nr:SMC family ATPase [Candidatus Obscuribacterales bacterium]
MSYADASLDLSPISVACLTGPNGAGKSALLDAVSWALWDTARAPSDELIRLGQTEMRVDLCFGLEGQVYRVRRSRQRSFGKSGQRVSTRGSLDVHVWDGEIGGWSKSLATNSANGTSPGESEDAGGPAQNRGTQRLDAGAKSSGTPAEESRDRTTAVAVEVDDEQGRATSKSTTGNGKWISLNATGMRETQERLRELLRMDYDSFVSSVYLRQGRADEFTIRSAAERKQVLAEILGLDYFDRLQELAREDARDCKARIQLLESALVSASELEKGLVESLNEIENTNTTLAQCEAQLAETREQIDSTKKRLSDIKLAELRQDAAIARRTELRTDSGALIRRHEETVARLQILRATIADEQAIRDQSIEFQQVKELVEDMDNMAMRYHDLNGRRLELRSKIATTRGRIEVEIEHFEAGVKDLNARKAKLEKSIKGKDSVEDAYRSYRALLNEEQDMARRREAFSALTQRVDELHTMVVEARLRLEAEVQQRTSLLTELDQLIQSRAVLATEQDELKKKSEDLDRLENEFELVEERGLKLKAEHDSLAQQLSQCQSHIRENEEKERELKETPNLSSCPLCRSPIVDFMAVMQRYHEDTDSVHREISTLRDRMQTLEDERGALRKQYVELRHRLEERSGLDTRIGEFNEKQSALERAETTRNELRKDLDLSKRKLEEQGYAQIERESLVRIKGEIAKLEFDPIIFSNLQSQIRAQRGAEFRWQQLQSDLRELSELEKDIPEKENKIAELKRFLEEDSFEHEARSELGALETEMKARPYDRDAHQSQKQRLSQLLPAAERLNELTRALAEEPALDAMSKELHEQIESKRREIARLESELSAGTDLIAEQEESEALLQSLQDSAQALDREREELARKSNHLAGKLGQLKAGKDELDAKRNELLQLLDELSELQRLIDVYGKKGIQAIIIDNAIPEIEAEANRILSRLSDNRMHVGLVTQHRTARGTAVETLDILIADELGTRSYELYSGGESFKVNFALRVALSRLLARRAGAKLETLIIDEGFGSQDEQSRERLIRAINSIRTDFARILVVTHIAEVKDMFPSQIVVSKEDGVSRVSIAGI